MTTITLLPDIDQSLQQESERLGSSLETLANEWLRQHRAALRRQRISEQTQRFWAKHAELYAQYPNQYVAFYNEAVLDHGDDVRELAVRVQTKYGDLPAVISQVTNPPVRRYKVISSHLQKSTP